MARRSLRNKFEDLALDKPLEIEIEDRTLELEVYAPDVSTFMLIGQQEEIEKKHMDDLEKTLRDILYRTYLPYYNKAGDKEMQNLSTDQKDEQEAEKEFIEGLLSRYFLQLFTETTKALGWHDEDINAPGVEEAKKKASKA